MILGFSGNGTESEVLKLGQIELMRSRTATGSGVLGYATGPSKRAVWEG